MSALCEAFIKQIIGQSHLKPGYVVAVLESDSDLGCSFEALTTPEAGDLFFLATYLPVSPSNCFQISPLCLMFSRRSLKQNKFCKIH